jgi:hypothetical protein
LLARLDTGFLSGTKTWFRGVFGRMTAPAEGEQTEASIFLENAVLAGEAFVTLKCFVDKAVLLVNEEIKNDSVAKKRARLAKRNAEISARRAQFQKLADDFRTEIQTAIANGQQQFDTLQKQVIDASAALMPYTRSTGEGGRSTTPQQADDLKTAQKWLQDVNGALETFRTGTLFQAFMKLGDRDIPVDDTKIGELRGEWSDELSMFDAKAEEVYKEARLALQNAKRLSQDVPALSKELEAIAPQAPVQFSAEGSKDFTMVNPMFKAKSRESETVLSAPGSEAATSNPQTPASSSPGTPVVAPATELSAPGTSEAEASIDIVFAKDSPAFEGQWPSKLRPYFYANIVKSTPPESLEWELVFSYGTDAGGEAKDYADRLTRALEEAIPKFKTEAAKNAATAIRNYIPTALSLEEERRRAKEKKRAEAQRIRREKLEDPNDTTVLELTEDEYETLSPEGQNHWERKEIFHPEEGPWIGNPNGSPAYTEVKYIRKAPSSSGLVGVVSGPVPETPGLTVPGRAAELKAATEAETARLNAEAMAKADQAAAEEAARAALVPGAPSGAPNIVNMYTSTRNLTGQPPKARPLTQAPSIPVPSGPPPVRPPPTRTVKQIEKDIAQVVKEGQAFAKGEGNVANMNVTQDIGNKSEELDRRLDQLEEELRVAKEAEAAKRKGGRSRKSTFKRRRGGKQNGRRTRRGKNRANRSHSNSRRRT